ncbi:MAG TPA: alpha/beta hydrolase-fold protein [Vicinamibacterales bacterium]|nr:alpha/beta hydrolase-fold protein [Vicinamibacterales bacterium]
MRNVAAAICLVIGAAVWLGAQAPVMPPQAPLSGLPPVAYSLPPEAQPQPGVPKGTVTKHVLAPGKFYPGTPHSYQLYVPAQYDAGRPAPFMIFLDGSGYAGDGVRVPVVFDNLIAKGDIPPMIAMFIDPGVMPALSDQAQNRYERIFEYDSLTPRFANFLIEELIPEVGKTYTLSKDPNDHGIAGLSTGAVGSFVAAWNRPDQFRRVITWIGSFGNFRGADRLPGLIRRTEPRPIRVFMQSGRQDLNNYAGSWYLENPRMAAALEFAGNDVKIELGEEDHNNRHGASILPDTLRWLWRGYPQPITVGVPGPGAGRGIFAQLVPRRELVPAPPNPARQGGGGRAAPPPAAAAQGRGGPAGRGGGPRGTVYSLIYPDKLWEQVGDTYKSAASPAVDKDGNVFFADPAGNRIYKSDAARTVAVFKENTGGARALRFGADGRLYAAQPAARRIVSYGPAGDEKIVAQNIQANDLALTRTGAIYFVDTAQKSVGYLDEKGQRRVVYSGGEIMSPAALTLTPDQAMLLVGDGMDRYQWSFQIAADGSLINGEPFQRLEMPEEGLFSGVAGLAVDSIGYMWATSAMGIQVCEQPGRCTNILNKPEFNSTPITSIAFGGPDRAWLYVTQGGKLFRRETKRTGVVAWEPVKPPQPGL